MGYSHFHTARCCWQKLLLSKLLVCCFVCMTLVAEHYESIRITYDQLRIMHRAWKKKRMKQVNKKPSLRESWWDIEFEGNGGVKSKETRFCNKVIVLYLAHEHSICYKRAKYRTMTFSLCYRTLFSCFLHHHCLQILYPTNFLVEKVFYLLVIS